MKRDLLAAPVVLPEVAEVASAVMRDVKRDVEAAQDVHLAGVELDTGENQIAKSLQTEAGIDPGSAVWQTKALSTQPSLLPIL